REFLVAGLEKYTDRSQRAQQSIERRWMGTARPRQIVIRLSSFSQLICDTKGSGDMQCLRHLVRIDQPHQLERRIRGGHSYLEASVIYSVTASKAVTSPRAPILLPSSGMLNRPHSTFHRTSPSCPALNWIGFHHRKRTRHGKDARES